MVIAYVGGTKAKAMKSAADADSQTLARIAE